MSIIVRFLIGWIVVFSQSCVPNESFTREAAMIEALGLDNLSNKVRGKSYGLVGCWEPKRRRKLGVFLLHKAFQLYLIEGEHQLRRRDLKWIKILNQIMQSIVASIRPHNSSCQSDQAFSYLALPIIFNLVATGFPATAHLISLMIAVSGLVCFANHGSPVVFIHLLDS